MRTITAALLLLAVAGAASAAPVTDPTPVPEVLAVVRACQDGWNAGDLEGYMAGYWRSDELRFASGGTATLGWEATLARYQGTYQLRPGRNMPLRQEEGALRMEEWLLLPVSATEFFSPQDYGRIQVVLGEDGGVERLDWTADGRTFPMPRVGDLPD